MEVAGKRLGASQAASAALAGSPKLGSGVILLGSWEARAENGQGRSWLGMWGTTEVESSVGWRGIARECALGVG